MSMRTRKRTETEQAMSSNNKYVHCDNDCRALKDPGDDVAQLKKSLEHWEHHSWLNGCSHAN